MSALTQPIQFRNSRSTGWTPDYNGEYEIKSNVNTKKNDF